MGLESSQITAILYLISLTLEVSLFYLALTNLFLNCVRNVDQ